MRKQRIISGSCVAVGGTDLAGDGLPRWTFEVDCVHAVGFAFVVIWHPSFLLHQCLLHALWHNFFLHLSANLLSHISEYFVITSQMIL